MFLKTRRNKIIFGLVLGLIIISLSWFGFVWYHFQNTPFAIAQPTTVIVTPGLSIAHLARDLSQRGILSSPQLFVLMTTLRGETQKLRIGEYEINNSITPSKLLENIVKGRVYLRKITFIEGWTFSQMSQHLAANSYLHHNLNKKKPAEIMSALGHPNQHPEGLFFPDTYIYTWGNSDELILKQAYAAMQHFLAEQWRDRAANLPYENPYQALIVASLIEKEAVMPAERSMIAGVILRRWQKKMRLQIDPTVLYGVGKANDAIIYKQDLQNDNPYNTYRNSGLPPTPIAMPSAASIYAALHPALGDALFYVSQGDGSHHFSSTYEEHLAAVAKYRSWQKSQSLPNQDVNEPINIPVSNSEEKKN